MSEHTPGPCKSTTVHGEGTSLLLIMAEGPTQIAKVTGGSYADARLMAAAPELLAAAVAAREDLSNITFGTDIESTAMAKLKRAIRKAVAA